MHLWKKPDKKENKTDKRAHAQHVSQSHKEREPLLSLVQSQDDLILRSDILGQSSCSGEGTV